MRVGVTEARANLSELLRRVKEGVTITRRGQPVATLNRAYKPQPLRAEVWKRVGCTGASPLEELRRIRGKARY